MELKIKCMHLQAPCLKNTKNKNRMLPVRTGVIALCLIHRRTDSLGYLVAASSRTVGYQSQRGTEPLTRSK